MTAWLNINPPIPAERRITVHDFDALGDEVIADAVGCGEVLGGARLLARGEGGFDFGFYDGRGDGANAEVFTGYCKRSRPNTGSISSRS